MATGFTLVRSPRILPEQVLAHFGIGINEDNKAICPFHADTEPSMQVNKEYVFCYGCGESYDAVRLAEQLLKKNGELPSSTIDWLNNAKLPECSERDYRVSKYQGAINGNLIEYWQQCLKHDPVRLQELQDTRLLTLDTIQHFKLGWRPDHQAFVIPFLYQGQADIVQFRSTHSDKAGSKYYGIEGHQRGSVVNRDILDKPQDYVVVLLGAFDATLAWQDGLPAVGLNGAMPFKRTEKARVKEIFKSQKLIFIVPDNTEAEFKEARKLASWLNAEVRYFPEELPPNCDYMDFRKLGKTVEDFKIEVLGIEPYQQVTPTLIENLFSLFQVGDPKKFAAFHWNNMAKGFMARDIGISLANQVTNLSRKRQLLNVQNEHDLIAAFQIQGDW